MSQSPVIVWLRNDLRVADNPALYQAARTEQPVLVLYIYDEVAERPLGAASEWWLHHSLMRLNEDLSGCGLKLHIERGNPQVIIPSLVQETGASAVHWNRRYDAYGIETDTAIKKTLKDEELEAQSYKANLLREPWDVQTGSGTYYKVFTPYWKNCLKMDVPDKPLPTPEGVINFDTDIGGVSLAQLELLPSRPDWSGGFSEYWTPGSTGAFEKLSEFLDGVVENYNEDRNRPDKRGTSQLSPHLAFGEISPRQIWHATKSAYPDEYKFLSEIGWREFSYTLLFYNPKLASENFKPVFDAFKWDKNVDNLKAWQQGLTGYPFVDAGMRELWATGWQHNRVRMVTASFLIKHLLIHWRDGEAWFWDTLVDADPASNSASWQWVAGSGADAAPYFRIFNPFSQGRKFDPKGEYVRKWCPELARLPDKFIHTPWEAPALVLMEAGVKLGGNYPEPIVEHKFARERALASYKATHEDTD